MQTAILQGICKSGEKKNNGCIFACNVDILLYGSKKNPNFYKFLLLVSLMASNL